MFAEVSSVTGYSQGYPTISQREASTSATVRDGESFVIGGLTQESDLVAPQQDARSSATCRCSASSSRSENTSRAKTDLYIVVTPHVVRGLNSAPPTAAPSK